MEGVTGESRPLDLVEEGIKAWAVVEEGAEGRRLRRERRFDVVVVVVVVVSEASFRLSRGGSSVDSASAVTGTSADGVAVRGPRRSSSSEESSWVQSSCWPNSKRRSFKDLIRFRCWSSCSCAVCFLDWVLRDEARCSRRRRRVRAYSRFLRSISQSVS